MWPEIYKTWVNARIATYMHTNGCCWVLLTIEAPSEQKISGNRLWTWVLISLLSCNRQSHDFLVPVWLNYTWFVMLLCFAFSIDLFCEKYVFGPLDCRLILLKYIITYLCCLSFIVFIWLLHFSDIILLAGYLLSYLTQLNTNIVWCK